MVRVAHWLSQSDLRFLVSWYPNPQPYCTPSDIIIAQIQAKLHNPTLSPSMLFISQYLLLLVLCSLQSLSPGKDQRYLVKANHHLGSLFLDEK